MSRIDRVQSHAVNVRWKTNWFFTTATVLWHASGSLEQDQRFCAPGIIAIRRSESAS
jgi:hypothetical protein